MYPTLASNLGIMYDDGVAPPRTGNRHGGLSMAPYNVYPAADSYFAVIVLNEEHWRRLAEAMSSPSLAMDPRFCGPAKGVENMEDLDRLIGDWGRRFSSDNALARLWACSVPCAPVRDLVEVANDRHMHQRGMLTWIEHSEFGRIAVPESPIRLHGAGKPPLRESPHLGQASRQVLGEELGLSRQELDELQAAGVI